MASGLQTRFSRRDGRGAEKARLPANPAKRPGVRAASAAALVARLACTVDAPLPRPRTGSPANKSLLRSSASPRRSPARRSSAQYRRAAGYPRVSPTLAARLTLKDGWSFPDVAERAKAAADAARTPGRYRAKRRFRCRDRSTACLVGSPLFRGDPEARRPYALCRRAV